ncbi:hypothetical protein [Staphylococcus equorum]|uniref:hypothetical protein n=1 Tax=Staphylococcus equorum TaxID=246432 RepID=UPI0008062787|nr:hypothetical protein [Staphylococcus equorum]ANQ65635.1 hypothetical protein AVJ22_13275 [Staphylococcus equorum]
MSNNIFKAATTKQYELAIHIKERIIHYIDNMEDIKELNELANTNIKKEELLNFFIEKNDFKYFIEQNNINTNSVIVSAMLKLSR